MENQISEYTYGAGAREPRASMAVIIPTYREADNVLLMIDRIREVSRCSIVIVDDVSEDGIESVLANASDLDGITLLQRRGGRSFGGSIVVGLQWAVERMYNAIAVMDCDLSHSPGDLSRFCAEVTKCPRDRPCLVVGSRLIAGGVDRRRNVFRRILTTAGSQLFRIATGCEVMDPTSGYRCVNILGARAILESAIRTNGFFFHVDALLVMMRENGVIREMPITFAERNVGRSKLCFSSVLEWGIAIAFALIEERLPFLYRRQRRECGAVIQADRGKNGSFKAPKSSTIRPRRWTRE